MNGFRGKVNKPIAETSDGDEAEDEEALEGIQF